MNTLEVDRKLRPLGNVFASLQRHTVSDRKSSFRCLNPLLKRARGAVRTTVATWKFSWMVTPHHCTRQGHLDVNDLEI